MCHQYTLARCQAQNKSLKPLHHCVIIVPHQRITDRNYTDMLPNHYAQMDTNYGKNAYWTSFLWVQMGTHLIFLQVLLCCTEILLENYPVRQFTMMSNLVVKWNLPNTNVIVNYHILIIYNWSEYSFINFHSNWQIFAWCSACYLKWIAIPNTLFKKIMYISVIFW